jgi:putative acetyltransferase
VTIHLRAVRPDDGPTLRALWVAAWQATMPEIDFSARADWLTTRLGALEAAGAAVICAADAADRPVGFVTIDPYSGEIDQLAVDPRRFGGGVAKALLDEAKRRAPGRLWLTVNQSNARALRFYRREGLRLAGADRNPTSGLPTWRMVWP